MTVDLFNLQKVHKRMFEIEKDAEEFVRQILIDSHCSDLKLVSMHSSSRNDTFSNFVDDKANFKLHIRFTGICSKQSSKKLLFDFVIAYKNKILSLEHWRLV
jgi:hypothetical protein